MIGTILSKQRLHNRILLSVLMVVLYPSLLLAENIPLSKKGGVYEVPVEINGVITLNFVLDTGASEVNIPADVALTLYRTGTIKDADFLPGQTYRLADGSEVNSSRLVLRSLKIGQRRITNVAASIGSISSPLLLGQSFLEKLGAWGIDNQQQVLIIGEKVKNESVQQEKKEQGTNVVYPGERVGNFVLGMTKEQVMKLGKPHFRYNLANRLENWTYQNKKTGNMLGAMFSDNTLIMICFTNDKFDTVEGITTANFDQPHEQLVSNPPKSNDELIGQVGAFPRLSLLRARYNYRSGGLFYTLDNDSQKKGCVSKQ